jgi:creatinine amidohydrolase
VERHLQKLSWLKIKGLVPSKINTILLPVGTVEAHGSSCLGTDNFIPEAIAEGIAERLNAIIAPTVSYGITKSLYRYKGSSTIETSTFKLYVRDILDSFARSDFKNIIILNGHGGNNDALKTVAYEFHKENKANICVIHWWELCEDFTSQFYDNIGGHAGNNETAMVHAIDPALAGEEDYDPDLAYWYRPGANVYPVPGNILLYKEGEGYPDFDEKKAKEYQRKVIEIIGDFVELVIKRWKKFDL